MEKVSELGERAQGWYAALRTRLETPENIGKLVSIDVETGDYAIGDDDSLTAPRSLREKNPSAQVFTLRIGYSTVCSFGG